MHVIAYPIFSATCINNDERNTDVSDMLCCHTTGRFCDFIANSRALIVFAALAAVWALLVLQNP